MPRCGSSGVQHGRGPAYAFSLSPARLRTPARGKGVMPRTHGLLLTRFLTLFAACLGAAFAAPLVLEAFDGDLDLWPVGAEDFTLAPHADLGIGGQPFSTVFALSALQSFVMTAGAHLVVRHRARSALVTDSPIPLRAFPMAEPWVLDRKSTPVLGHLFSIWWAHQGCRNSPASFAPVGFSPGTWGN